MPIPLMLNIQFWQSWPLSQKWLVFIPDSVVHRPSVCRPHSLNIFFSENTGPTEAKFHMESPWDEGNKVCSNGHGHMTKMAVMPIYMVKTLKKSSPEPKGRWLWNLICSIGCSSTLMTLGWPWPILQQGQILPFMLLYEKKVKQWIFQKLLSSTIWN